MHDIMIWYDCTRTQMYTAHANMDPNIEINRSLPMTRGVDVVRSYEVQLCNQRFEVRPRWPTTNPMTHGAGIRPQTGTFLESQMETVKLANAWIRTLLFLPPILAYVGVNDLSVKCLKSTVNDVDAWWWQVPILSVHFQTRETFLAYIWWEVKNLIQLRISVKVKVSCASMVSCANAM